MEDNFMNKDGFTVKIVEGQPFVYMKLDQTIDAVKQMFDLAVEEKENKNVKSKKEKVMVLSVWGSVLEYLKILKEKNSIPLIRADWYNSEQ